MKSIIRFISPFVIIFATIFIMSYFKHEESLEHKETEQIKSFFAAVEQEELEQQAKAVAMEQKQEEEIMAMQVSATEMSLNDKGESVETLQQRLKDLGIFQEEVTGVYGPSTESAIKEFQAQNQLPVTGTADPETLTVLVKMTANNGGVGNL